MFKRHHLVRKKRASKRAHTWCSCTTTPKSLYGQPNPDLIQTLAIKGFWGSGTVISSKGSFLSSCRGRSHTAFRFIWHFLGTKRSLLNIVIKNEEFQCSITISTCPPREISLATLVCDQKEGISAHEKSRGFISNWPEDPSWWAQNPFYKFT